MIYRRWYNLDNDTDRKTDPHWALGSWLKRKENGNHAEADFRLITWLLQYKH